MGIHPEAIQQEALRWTRKAKHPERRNDVAAEAARFVAGQRSLELRLQSLAAWRGQVHRWSDPFEPNEWAAFAPAGRHVSSFKDPKDRTAWIACSRSPNHRQVREAAAWSFADGAPKEWLMAEWDEIGAWGRSSNPELQSFAVRAIQRLSMEAPGWLAPRWTALLRSRSVRDNVLAAGLLLRPLGRSAFADNLETLLAVASTLSVDQGQELGLRVESELNYWGRLAPPHAEPMTLKETEAWLGFLDRLLVEAPQLYFVGHQGRSLLLATIRTGCQVPWDRACVDLALQAFRRRPADHIGQGWRDWFSILLRNQFWEETALVLDAAKKANQAGLPRSLGENDLRLMRERLMRSQANPGGLLEGASTEGWLQAAAKRAEKGPLRTRQGLGLTSERRGEAVIASILALESAAEIPSEAKAVARLDLRDNAEFLALARYWQGWRQHERWTERNARQLARIG